MCLGKSPRKKTLKKSGLGKLDSYQKVQLSRIFYSNILSKEWRFEEFGTV